MFILIAAVDCSLVVHSSTTLRHATFDGSALVLRWSQCVGALTLNVNHVIKYLSDCKYQILISQQPSPHDKHKPFPLVSVENTCSIDQEVCSYKYTLNYTVYIFYDIQYTWCKIQIYSRSIKSL